MTMCLPATALTGQRRPIWPHVRSLCIRYAVSSWHQLADSSERFAYRRFAPGWLFRTIGWVFRHLGSASAHPSAKEYLAPLRMKVGVFAFS